MPHDSLEEELAAESIRSEDLKRMGWKNHENSDAEQMRRKLLAYSDNEWVWKREIADMQKSVHDSHVRIKELNDEIFKLTRRKNMKKWDWNSRFGEGTNFDLDYGKLFIIGLCIYIAFQVS
tara:strand:+ start:19 stop:381 length:363 start_codon:yes stop_codon:yes gene_type:complete